MVNGIYSAISALKGFGKKLGVTAHNVANINTDEFKKSKAVFQQTPPSGVMVSINRIETPGFPLPAEEGTSEVRESSNVELEEEVINLVTTKHAYTANLKTLKTEDEILGTILDIVDK